MSAECILVALQLSTCHHVKKAHGTERDVTWWDREKETKLSSSKPHHPPPHGLTSRSSLPFTLTTLRPAWKSYLHHIQDSTLPVHGCSQKWLIQTWNIRSYLKLICQWGFPSYSVNTKRHSEVVHNKAWESRVLSSRLLRCHNLMPDKVFLCLYFYELMGQSRLRHQDVWSMKRHQHWTGTPVWKMAPPPDCTEPKNQRLSARGCKTWCPLTPSPLKEC